MYLFCILITTIQGINNCYHTIPKWSIEEIHAYLIRENVLIDINSVSISKRLLVYKYYVLRNRNIKKKVLYSSFYKYPFSCYKGKGIFHSNRDNYNNLLHYKKQRMQRDKVVYVLSYSL